MINVNCALYFKNVYILAIFAQDYTLFIGTVFIIENFNLKKDIDIKTNVVTHSLDLLLTSLIES